MFRPGNLHRFSRYQHTADRIRADIVVLPFRPRQKIDLPGAPQPVLVTEKLQYIALGISQHHDEAGALKEPVQVAHQRSRRTDEDLVLFPQFAQPVLLQHGSPLAVGRIQPGERTLAMIPAMIGPTRSGSIEPEWRKFSHAAVFCRNSSSLGESMRIISSAK